MLAPYQALWNTWVSPFLSVQKDKLSMFKAENKLSMFKGDLLVCMFFMMPSVDLGDEVLGNIYAC